MDERGEADRAPVRKGRRLGTRRARRARNAEIVEAFDGDNHRELATKWGLSVRTIYRIVGGR